MISSLHALHAFLQTSGLLPVLDHWQSLIAGLLSLLAGLVVFFGALIAAGLEVWAMRRATAAQIAMMRQTTADQIAALQEERKETDNRRRSVVKWAIRAEGQRLDKEVVRVRPQFLVGGTTAGAQALIESSPLLRGEREDAALLDGATFATLEEAARTLNNYNHLVETAVTATQLAELQEVCPKLLGEIAALADKLKK